MIRQGGGSRWVDGCERSRAYAAERGGRVERGQLTGDHPASRRGSTDRVDS